MQLMVLGATGMLGSMVHGYLAANPALRVVGTARRQTPDRVLFDVRDGIDSLSLDGVDFVINCIGVTKPYCHDDDMAEVANAIAINAAFPHALAARCEERGVRVIQIATDCVYSGREGAYTEESPHDPLDVYGKTKSLGEVRRPHFLNIRSSIIGPERGRRDFLMEWFLGHEEGATVNGFSHHRWNGVTTLQFAQLCERIVRDDLFDRLAGESCVHHFVPNAVVTKYELLKILNDVFERGVEVREVSGGGTIVDRTLGTTRSVLPSLFPTRTMDSAILDLERYMQQARDGDA